MGRPDAGHPELQPTWSRISREGAHGDAHRSDAGCGADGAGRRPAGGEQLGAIKQDIEASLHRPDLSLAAIAGRHRCTPRGVQRLFETEGTTFGELVLCRRIARAYRQLSSPRQAVEKISTIAYNSAQQRLLLQPRLPPALRRVPLRRAGAARRASAASGLRQPR